MTKAYLLGFICGATGKQAYECPYNDNEEWQMRSEWLSGHSNADHEYDALMTVKDLFGLEDWNK